MSNSRVTAQGLLGPPTTGLSEMTHGVVRLLEAGGYSVELLNLGPASKTRFRGHLVRARAELGAIRSLRPKPNNVVYRTASGGYGQIFDICFAVASAMTSTRVTWHHHTADYLRNPTVLWRVLSKLTTEHAHIVLAESLVERLPKSKRTEHARQASIRNRAFMQPCAGRQQGELARRATVGFLGNPLPSKGIGAFSRLSDHPTLRDTRFLAAGSRDFDDLGGPNWHSLGPLGAAGKRSFFQEIDLLVFPSTYRFETWPVVIEEALRAGVYVIAFDVGFTTELLADRQDGVTVPASTSLEDLAELCVSTLPAARKGDAKVARAKRWEQGRIEDSATATRTLAELMNLVELPDHDG